MITNINEFKNNMKKECYDSTADTQAHVNRVSELLHEAAETLINRANVHDDSKFLSPEKELFDEYTPLLKTATYGSDKYKEFLKGLKVALDHHYANNSHHPEFYKFKEEWRDIPNIDGYQVSSYGQIRSKDKTVIRENQGDFFKSGKILKGHLTPKGYVRIQILGKNYMCHRLVAITFLENPNNLPQVNHKNGIKHDNKLSNLEWITASKNQIHAYENGLKKPNVKYIVKSLDFDIVTEGCIKMEHELRERGYKNASAAAIWGCINGTNNTHLDLKFEGYPIKELGNISYINGFDLFDLVECFFDWKAATERHEDGDIMKSIEINKERFEMSEQLVDIFNNTAKRLGYDKNEE